jgi:hypothetical protein
MDNSSLEASGSGEGVAGVLNAAADLLDKPGAWIQHAWARDSAGRIVDFGDEPKAACWCADGAFEKVLGRRYVEHGDLRANLQAAFIAVHGCSPMGFNDAPKRTQSEVVQALRAAAKASEPTL